MAAFDHTKVDPDRLNVSARNIEESLKMAQRALGTIGESLLNDLRPTWSGEGSTAFYDRYNTDSSNFTALLSKLKALNEQLKQAAVVYDKADNEANELVSSLSIG